MAHSPEIQTPASLTHHLAQRDRETTTRLIEKLGEPSHRNLRPELTQVWWQDKVALNISQQALSLSVKAPDQMLTLVIGQSDEEYAHIFGTNMIGQPLPEHSEALTVENFESVFYETTAQAGIYKQAQTREEQETA